MGLRLALMPEVCHSASQNDQIGWIWYAVGGSVLGACLFLPIAGDPGFERNKVFAVAFCAAVLLAVMRLQRVSRLGLALALAFAASALTAIDPARALIGSLERSQGVLLALVLSVFALARLPWPVCRFWIAMAAFLSSVWALIQLAGMESLTLALTWQNAEPQRVFAGFGNPTALGGFLAMALPVCAELAVKDARKSARTLGFVSCVLGAAALFASGTRASLLGLAIAILSVLWLSRYPFRTPLAWLPESGRVFWPVLGSAVLGMLILAVILFSVERNASVQHRIELWKDSGAALANAAQSKPLLDAPFAEQFSGELPVERFIAARIWLGFGADLQVVPLSAAQYRSQLLTGETPVQQAAGQQFSDRAHNLFLDSLFEFA